MKKGKKMRNQMRRANERGNVGKLAKERNQRRKENEKGGKR